MRKEAAEAGIWQTKSLSGSKHPRLQILTIEELLAGKKIDMPAQQDIRSFKQALKAKNKKSDDVAVLIDGAASARALLIILVLSPRNCHAERYSVKHLGLEVDARFFAEYRSE